MNSGQRTAISLILTGALFTAFIFTSYSYVFTKIETEYYEVERLKKERDKLKESSEFCNSYIQEILDTLNTEYVSDNSVRSFLLQTPTETDVSKRTQLSLSLFSKFSGLDGIRLIDKNGRNIHYSTYSDDILRQNGQVRVYKNYPDIVSQKGEQNFSAISILESEAQNGPKISLNKKKSNIIFSLPVFDKYDVFRGIFAFYFKTSDLQDELVKSNLISVDESVSFFSSDDGKSIGVVLDVPKVGEELFSEPILDAWTTKSIGPNKLVSKDEENFWVMISDFDGKYLSVGKSFQSDYFSLPLQTKFLICISVFVTAFLVLFLLLSLKRDDMVIIRNRIKKVQRKLISEYTSEKNKLDYNQKIQQLEERKAELFSDVKTNLGKRAKKHEKKVNVLLEKSWQEVLFAIQADEFGGMSIVPQSFIPNFYTFQNGFAKGIEEKQSGGEQAEEIHITNTVDAGEGIEEIEEILEEIEEKIDEEIPEIEDAEEIEDLSEEEPLEEIPEIEEAEEIEELSEEESLEEIPEIEDAEEIEELSEEEPLEEIPEVEEAEEIEELSEEETLEEIPEIEDAEEIEELSEEEPLEEIPEIEEVEEITEAEDVTEFEEADLSEFMSDDPTENPVYKVEDIKDETIFSDTDDGFASVDNFFAEALSFGVAYTTPVGESIEGEKPFEFEATVPAFGLNESLLPMEENNYFSMTTLGENNNYISDLVSASEFENTIIENNGVFSISEKFVAPKINLDRDFKKLVDSVLR